MAQLKKFLAALMIVVLLLSGAACAAPETGEEITAVFPLELVVRRPQTVYHQRNTFYHLTAEGKLYGWGWNYCYLLGLPLPEQYSSLDETVLVAEDVADIACVNNRTFILKTDGSVWVIGEYPNPDRDSDWSEKWVKVTDGVAAISNVSLANNGCVILKTNGEMYVCGSPVLGFNKTNIGTLRLVDTGVSKLGGLYTVEARAQYGYASYFLYYKGGTVCGFTEEENAEFDVMTLHQNVKHVTQNPIFYIDASDNLYLKGEYYVNTNSGWEKRTVDKPLLVAKNVAECITGDRGGVAYLTQEGELYEYNKFLEDAVSDTKPKSVGGMDFYLKAEGVKKICREYYSQSSLMMYFLKDDDSLWAFGEAYYSGAGDVILADSNIFPTATVKNYHEEPVKVLDSVKEFSFTNSVKVATTMDGQRYIWGLSVKMREGMSGGSGDWKDFEGQYVYSIWHADYAAALEAKPIRAQIYREDSYLYPVRVEEVFNSFCE